MTAMQGLGAAGLVAAGAYGGYKSGGALGAGLGGAGGAVLAAGLFTANPAVMAVGLGLMIVSQMTDMFKTQKDTVTVESRQQTLQVASRIDVTNRTLELVNRNLIALRQELTYIMPRSAYFSESRGNIEDQFSIDSRRG